jgi:hypothetical protein
VTKTYVFLYPMAYILALNSPLGFDIPSHSDGEQDTVFFLFIMKPITCFRRSRGQARQQYEE